jgi:hypothetical protein
MNPRNRVEGRHFDGGDDGFTVPKAKFIHGPMDDEGSKRKPAVQDHAHQRPAIVAAA